MYAPSPAEWSEAPEVPRFFAALVLLVASATFALQRFNPSARYLVVFSVLAFILSLQDANPVSLFGSFLKGATIGFLFAFGINEGNPGFGVFHVFSTTMVFGGVKVVIDMLL